MTRKEGRDPAHGATAAQARRDGLAKRRRETREWEKEHGPTSPGEFTRTVLPHLNHVTVRQMAKATGLSTGYCTMIRRGQYTPRPRHWDALKNLLTNHTYSEAKC